MGKLITKQQAADILGLSRQTIQNWIDKGILRCIVVSKAHYLDSATIEAFSDEMKDVENSRQKLKELKRELDAKQKEVADKITTVKEELCLLDDGLSFIRKKFYLSIPSMLSQAGLISYEESNILLDVIQGVDAEKVCHERNITVTDIKAIANKALKGLCDYETLQKEHNSIKERNYNMAKELEDAHKAIEYLRNKMGSSYDKFKGEQMKKYEEYYNRYMFLNAKLKDINFSTRVQNVLADNNMVTLGDLVKYKEKEIKEIHGFGRTCLFEVKDLLDGLDLYFGYPVDEVYENYYLHIDELKEYVKEKITILETKLEDTQLVEKDYFNELISNKIITIKDLASFDNYSLMFMRPTFMSFEIEKELEAFLEGYGLGFGYNAKSIYQVFETMFLVGTIYE